MLIKKETEYAILGVVALAGADGYRDVKEIAKNNHISPTLLAKAFLKLKAHGILESKLGPDGGFRLKKKISEINLFQILSATQKRCLITNCYSGKASYCKTPCPLKDSFSSLEQNISQYLKNVKLSDFIK